MSELDILIMLSYMQLRALLKRAADGEDPDEILISLVEGNEQVQDDDSSS